MTTVIFFNQNTDKNIFLCLLFKKKSNIFLEPKLLFWFQKQLNNR